MECVLSSEPLRYYAVSETVGPDEGTAPGLDASPDVGRSRRRTLVAAVLALIVLGAGLLVMHAMRATPEAGAASGAVPEDVRERFVALKDAHSNWCGLQGADLAAMDGSSRLQGACCQAMDLDAYAEQRRGLQAFAAEPTIPQDPYDVSVDLARELLSYRSITLSSDQQMTFDAAEQTAREHGPCCCHCWRWDAFEGQAKYLITRRGFDAATVANVWDLEDGCGGKAD
jgi:hypothetical protein